MKSTRILPSVLIIATMLQTSNVYALDQEASASVSSVDSTGIAQTLQTLKAEYMDAIVDTDDFQSMYQQVQNQMASTEQLDLAEYYAQNYEITFPTENLYDLWMPIRNMDFHCLRRFRWHRSCMKTDI